ncbi:hypothetical protein GCM10027187_18490 [Streptosporangium sandarakinum]
MAGEGRVIPSLSCGKSVASGGVAVWRAWLVSRCVIERRPIRSRERRALRPLVLCGAMLAPALLATGLLVADLTGYGEAVRDAGAAGGPEGGVIAALPYVVVPVPDVAFGPRWVPPPPRPDRVYEGWMPGVVVARPRRPVEVAREPRTRLTAPRVTVPRDERTAEPAETPRPEAEPTPEVSGTPRPESADAVFECPKEWWGTWLWEVCEEQEWEGA